MSGARKADPRGRDRTPRGPPMPPAEATGAGATTEISAAEQSAAAMMEWSRLPKMGTTTATPEGRPPVGRAVARRGRGAQTWTAASQNTRVGRLIYELCTFLERVEGSSKFLRWWNP